MVRLYGLTIATRNIDSRRCGEVLDSTLLTVR
jgi:hypothetical protein